jgi:8-oxo-dGTP pyrophosphatase MutT (NUDIX family)
MMEFADLVSKLEPRLKLPLPGALAHEPIRAVPAGGIAPNFEHKLPPKPGSVLILLYPENGSIKFPLTKRQTYSGAHSDQVSLPGGKTEPGEIYIDTALREAEEEIGIDRSQVVVIGALSNFFVIPSNFMITPVIAYSPVKPVFKPDPFEVARIITGDLFDLISDDAVKEKEILAAGKYRMNARYFDIENEVVWGATAMMLNEFRLILREFME